ncbi:MAG: hypothetical protein ABIF87_07425 [Pseudomonadota bacterium]
MQPPQPKDNSPHIEGNHHDVTHNVRARHKDKEYGREEDGHQGGQVRPLTELPGQVIRAQAQTHPGDEQGKRWL